MQKFKPVTGVRRVCSTQSEVRVFGNGSEHWYFLSCPIVHLSETATDDHIHRQIDNVTEALERIKRQEWVTDDDYQKVIDQLYSAEGLVPYEDRVKFGGAVIL
jgi:hypothetical protein